MPLAEARTVEHAKYSRAYALPMYRMGGRRWTDALRNLADLPCRGSYLDVGCGRGETLTEAKRLGYGPICGVEVVPELTDGVRFILADGRLLPFADGAWDVVTLFDVVEHLLPGDDEAVCREVRRVARRHVLVTANNQASTLPDGTELHVNRRPYEEWAGLFAAWFAPASVYPAPCEITYEVSPMWRVDFA